MTFILICFSYLCRKYLFYSSSEKHRFTFIVLVPLLILTTSLDYYISDSYNLMEYYIIYNWFIAGFSLILFLIHHLWTGFEYKKVEKIWTLGFIIFSIFVILIFIILVIIILSFLPDKINLAYSIPVVVGTPVFIICAYTSIFLEAVAQEHPDWGKKNIWWIKSFEYCADLIVLWEFIYIVFFYFSFLSNFAFMNSDPFFYYPLPVALALYYFHKFSWIYRNRIEKKFWHYKDENIPKWDWRLIKFWTEATDLPEFLAYVIIIIYFIYLIVRFIMYIFF